MGIFTYIKIGLAVVLLSICGYYIWNYHHMATVVAEQKQEIENIKLGIDTLEKKQQKFDEYMAKSAQIKRRVSNEQKEIDKEVSTIDDTGLQQLYDRYRVRTQGEVRYPPAKGKSRFKGAVSGSP